MRQFLIQQSNELTKNHHVLGENFNIKAKECSSHNPQINHYSQLFPEKGILVFYVGNAKLLLFAISKVRAGNNEAKHK